MPLFRRRLVRRVALAALLSAGALASALLLGCQEAERRTISPILIRGDWVQGFLEFRLTRSAARQELALAFVGRNHTWYKRFTRFQVRVFVADRGWLVVDRRMGREGDVNFSESRTIGVPWTAAAEVELRVWLDNDLLEVEKIRLGGEKVAVAGTVLLHYPDSPYKGARRAPEEGATPEPTPTVPPPVGSGRRNPVAEPQPVGPPTGLPPATRPPGPTTLPGDVGLPHVPAPPPPPSPAASPAPAAGP